MMTREGIANIARYISVSQGREFTTDDMDVWLDALSDLDPSLAFQACQALVRETTAFITPALVRERYGRLATKRLQDADAPDLPDGLTTAQYMIWLREYRRLIITGQDSETANREALLKAGIDPTEHLGEGRSTIELPTLRSGNDDEDSDDVIDGEVVS